MSYPFVKAAHYRVGGNLPARWITIHAMQAPEKVTTAEAVANYFARGTVVASCHYCVDSDSIVQCVHEADTAFHAPPNRYSIGIELAGYAEQTGAEWADDFSTRMLNRAAILAAGICVRHGIPPVWLSVADLKAGRKGITSHANISKAFGQTHHWDPGPNFPVDYFIAQVRRTMFAQSITEGAIVTPPPPPVKLVGGKKMRQLIPVGPLDGQGNGWMPTDIPFDRWESATPNAVDPQTAGKYGPKVIASVCDHGGKVRVVVQGGEPRTTVGVYVVFSA